MVVAQAGAASHCMRLLANALTVRFVVAEFRSQHRFGVGHDGHIMGRKKTLVIVFSACVALLVLFLVSVNVEFSLPADKRVRDAEQEARYMACYAERDEELHATAFATIDNPDVQKLYISQHRAEAAEECRREFPEQWLTVPEPMRFNLVDLRFRYQ